MTRSPASPAGRSLRQWPLLIIVVGVLVGLGIAYVGDGSWRVGGLVIGATLAVGAVFRVVLPSREAGLLEVRSKGFDVTVLALAAAAIITLAIVVPNGR